MSVIFEKSGLVGSTIYGNYIGGTTAVMNEGKIFAAVGPANYAVLAPNGQIIAQQLTTPQAVQAAITNHYNSVRKALSLEEAELAKVVVDTEVDAPAAAPEVAAVPATPSSN